MSVDVAKEYFARSDDPSATVKDAVEPFAADTVLRSPRERIFRGKDEVRDFYHLNAKFFAEGGPLYRPLLLGRDHDHL